MDTRPLVSQICESIDKATLRAELSELDGCCKAVEILEDALTGYAMRRDELLDEALTEGNDVY